MSKIASDDQETRYILSKLDILEKEIIELKYHFTRRLRPSIARARREKSKYQSRSKSKSPVIISAKKQDSPESFPEQDIERPLIKNGNFEAMKIGAYICPIGWESSPAGIESKEENRGPVVTTSGWGPTPIPCDAPQFLALQPYNNRDICYVRQKLTLKKNSQYTLTFYGASARPPKGTLTVTIDSTEIFKEELPETWRKYTVEFTSPSRKPMLSFINYGIESANDESVIEVVTHVTSIACVNLIKNEP